MDKLYKIKNNEKEYVGDSRVKPFIFKNKRQNSLCVYCGEEATTREHLPSKVFFEHRDQIDFSILPACKKCNNNFSYHEKYLACYIEFLKSKIYNKDYKIRESIKNTLLKDHFIANKIKNQFKQISGMKYEVSQDTESIEIVLMKLAKGHMAYEMNEIFLDEPKHFSYKFLHDMTKKELLAFNRPVVSEIIPEIGSRLTEYLILTEDGKVLYPWRTISEGEYRFMNFTDKKHSGVKFVINEVLFCKVMW